MRRHWVRQMKGEETRRPGLAIFERKQLKTLERENQTIEILCKASARFAHAELGYHAT